MKKRTRKTTAIQIIVANVAETFSTIIGDIADLSKRRDKIAQENAVAQRALLWERDNKIIITPFAISAAIIDQYLTLGYANLVNWFPRNTHLSLSEAILADPILLKKLAAAIRRARGLAVISPYAYTQPLSRLITCLRQRDLVFSVDQEPTDRAPWLAHYLGSKVGFRVETLKLAVGDRFPKPEFFICDGKAQVASAAAWFFRRSKAFVVKASYGEGGWGVLLRTRRRRESFVVFQKSLNAVLEQDSIWNRGPFVVEEFIGRGPQYTSSPSVELFVDREGKCRVTHVSTQILDDDGAFCGVLIGKGAVSARTRLATSRAAKAVGERYAALGYRGIFDVDFVASRHQHYAVETNARRTGGTHVFDFATFVFGKHWVGQVACLSSDWVRYRGPIRTADELLRKVDRLRLRPPHLREGLVITSVSVEEPIFGVIIAARTKARAVRLYGQLLRVMNSPS